MRHHQILRQSTALVAQVCLSSRATDSGGAAAVRAEAIGAAAGGERHAVARAVPGRPAPHIAQGPELATGVQFLCTVGK